MGDVAVGLTRGKTANAGRRTCHRRGYGRVTARSRARSGAVSTAPLCGAWASHGPAERDPLENMIRLVTCRSFCSSGGMRVYSVIRPPRTGFRRICCVSTSVTVAWGASRSSSGTRWTMLWCGPARCCSAPAYSARTARRCALPRISTRSRSSRRSVPTRRSQVAFIRGALDGVAQDPVAGGLEYGVERSGQPGVASSHRRARRHPGGRGGDGAARSRRAPPPRRSNSPVLANTTTLIPRREPPPCRRESPSISRCDEGLPPMYVLFERPLASSNVYISGQFTVPPSTA
jgi:hypothetical protein